MMSLKKFLVPTICSISVLTSTLHADCPNYDRLYALGEQYDALLFQDFKGKICVPFKEIAAKHAPDIVALPEFSELCGEYGITIPSYIRDRLNEADRPLIDQSIAIRHFMIQVLDHCIDPYNINGCADNYASCTNYISKVTWDAGENQSHATGRQSLAQLFHIDAHFTGEKTPENVLTYLSTAVSAKATQLQPLLAELDKNGFPTPFWTTPKILVAATVGGTAALLAGAYLFPATALMVVMPVVYVFETARHKMRQWHGGASPVGNAVQSAVQSVVSPVKAYVKTSPGATLRSGRVLPKYTVVTSPARR